MGRADPSTGGALRAGIILAAGASSRMGTPKALLPWQGETLLAYAVGQQLQAGLTRVVVVLGAHADDVRAAVPALQGVDCVFNPRHAEGRATSVAAGAAALPDEAGVVVIQSVDQPCPAHVLARLCGAVERRGAAVALPVHGGRRGHPPAFAGRLLPELRMVGEEEQGLRAVVRRHAAATVELDVETDVVLLNLNDPRAYAQAADATHGGQA